MIDGKVIQLQGKHGFFSTVNPAWFEGRMSPAEYALFVETINNTVKDACVGLSKHLAFLGRGSSARLFDVIRRCERTKPSRG
jgi:hypothetical protein